MRSRGWWAVAASLLSFPAAAQPVAVAATAVEAEGTQFRLTLSDGRVLLSPALVGATLVIGTPDGPRKLRLAAVERDPDARSGDVWLHTMLAEAADGSWRNLCEAGPDGRAQGFPLASRTRADGGTETTAPNRFDLICTGGARGKCVRFGYRPWIAAEAPLYDSCTRMVRADYCGEGEGTTRNGMPIDLYDDAAIQRPDNAPDHAFEAGWTAAGAVCVAHVRVGENTSLDILARTCPRLSGHLGPDRCTEDAARAAGAILFNRSRP